MPQAAGLPKVSIIMAVRNAADTLAESVEGCLAQDYPGSFEVIIAAASDDLATRALAERYRPHVTVIENPERSTPAGLNHAIRAASGEVIVRCDGQARLPADYVSTAVSILEKTGAGNVGGKQRAVGSTLFERAVAIAQSTPLGVGDARYRLGGDPGPVDTVYLGVFRAEVLEQVGGYNEQLLRNQDYELNFRIRQEGETVWFDPRLVVDYLPRSTPAGLWRQYFDYGRWKRRVLRLHPSSLRWRQLAAPLLAIGLFVSAVALLLGATSLGLMIPGIYVAALAITGLWEAVRRRDLAGLITPAALVVMHIGWGVGFLTEAWAADRDNRGHEPWVREER